MNKERAQSIKSNIKAKEKELEQVETNYALCSDTKKQEICVKVMTRLEAEIRSLQVEYSKVNTEILNLDKFIDYAFSMRSNLFNLWELQGLEGRRRLQKLVFPDGFIYDKNNEHIEPKTVNQFFLLNYSFPTNNEDKKRERRTVKITVRPFKYSKRDLNPHSRNGQRILSPSCLPFHHSSILKKESGKRDSNSRP